MKQAASRPRPPWPSAASGSAARSRFRSTPRSPSAARKRAYDAAHPGKYYGVGFGCIQRRFGNGAEASLAKWELVAPAHDLADVRKAEELELADDLLDRHLGALSPGAHDLRDAGLNPNIS